MATAPDLTTCNLALAQVPSSPIASIGEASLAAREVTRAYPQCLNELLERHPFRFARKRQTLASIANDRPTEWLFAYQVPSDMASIQSVHIDPSNTPGLVCHHHHEQIDRPQYQVASTTIYCNLPSLILEYTTSNVQPAQFTAMFRNALVMEMAARIVMPILKSRERQGDLIKASIGAWDRAVADDANQAPDKTYSFEPHDMRARYAGSDRRYSDPWGY